MTEPTTPPNAAASTPKSSFIDPTIHRKRKILDTSYTVTADGIPLPSLVEVSPSGTCNRKCIFCPRSSNNYPDVKEFIQPSLIDKLTSQVGELGFHGLFMFSGFVEPLLDKNIFDLVAIVRRNLPDARVEMVTNGDVLSQDRLKRLIDSGLSTLLISVYDGPEAAERFEELCRGAGLEDGQFILRHRYLKVDQDFGINLSNRAGMMDNAVHAIPSLSEPLDKPCYYPHYTFFMDYLGDVLLCPHDWGKRFIYGNMVKQDFLEIWTSQVINMARLRLANSDRGMSPCDVCDVKGTLMGEAHAEAWAKLLKAEK